MQSIQVERRDKARHEGEVTSSTGGTTTQAVSGLRDFIRSTDATIHDYRLAIEHTQEGLVIDFRLKADLTFGNGNPRPTRTA
jgi:hypothetical protein